VSTSIVLAADAGYVDSRLLVIAVLASLLALGGLILLPKLWRMEADIQRDEATRAWWPFSEALREGFVRSVPAAILAVALLALALISGFFEQLLTGSAGAAAADATLLFGGGFLLMLVVDLCVTLFNQPKIVVPPAARDESGALSLWWKSRRNRPARRT